ncbi:CheY-like chemotaxis protein [Paraburkholderia sp. WSM4175]|uniref:response regulator n=1 Tax=Paraburkholderia sp. WSM4175 TaxID=2991072 RepID=UPI003D1BE954
MASVLLVDDDAEALAAWGACCAADGFEVRTAGDGQTALKMFIESPVDIVVADWRMPVMSGSELCHRLRTLPGLADVTFILVSGGAQPTSLRKLRRLSPQACRWANFTDRNASLAGGPRNPSGATARQANLVEKPPLVLTRQIEIWLLKGNAASRGKWQVSKNFCSQ